MMFYLYLFMVAAGATGYAYFVYRLCTRMVYRDLIGLVVSMLVTAVAGGLLIVS